MQKYRRRKFFFRKSPQGKYIFSYFLVAGMVAIIFTILLILFSADTISITYSNDTLQMDTTPSVLLDRLLGIHGILIFVFGFLIIYFATRFTHRTAGPIYKIGTTLDKMATGDVNIHIALRKNDDYKELADKLNRFSLFLFRELKAIEAVSKELKSLSAGALNNEELERLCNELETLLEHFSLSEEGPFPENGKKNQPPNL